MDLPLVTCICPTRDRRDFLRRSIELFLAQDYSRKRLVIVEDGESTCGDLLDVLKYHKFPYEMNVFHRHLGAGHRSIGEKRNIACEITEGGGFVEPGVEDFIASASIEAVKPNL